MNPELVDTVARVSARLQGRLASFKTHPFYRKMMLEQAENFLVELEGYGYVVIRLEDEGE